jgi:hypothetical protein
MVQALELSLSGYTRSHGLKRIHRAGKIPSNLAFEKMALVAVWRKRIKHHLRETGAGNEDRWARPCRSPENRVWGEPNGQWFSQIKSQEIRALLSSSSQ